LAIKAREAGKSRRKAAGKLTETPEIGQGAMYWLFNRMTESFERRVDVIRRNAIGFRQSRDRFALS
jgi:hypothetical protein